MKTGKSSTGLNILLITIIGTCCSYDVEVSRKPDGPIREGESVKILCKVQQRGILDLVRIVRIAGDVEHVLATNGHLEEQFRASKRYNVSWIADQGHLELEIINIKGQDGGQIGCKKLPEDTVKYLELTVMVPPRKVEMRYQVGEGGLANLAPDSSKISLKSDAKAVIMCTVIVDGTETKPEVVVTLDGMDVTSQFSHHPTRLLIDEDGMSVTELTSQYTRKINVVDLQLHGKNLTCRATMPMFPPLTNSIIILVNHEPSLKCSHGWVMRPGDQYFQISCLGGMHPEPISVTWAWLTPSNKSVNFVDGKPNDLNVQGYKTVQITLGGGDYNFILQFERITRTDLRRYDLNVANAEGVGQATVHLSEEAVGLSRIQSSSSESLTKYKEEVFKEKEKEKEVITPMPAIGRVSKSSASSSHFSTALLRVFLLAVAECLLRASDLCFSKFW